MATNDEMSNEAGSAFLPVILAGKRLFPDESVGRPGASVRR